jgi:hypothetical protein
MSKFKIFSVFFTCLLFSSLQAEYRVYQYYVKNKSKSLLDQKPYLVTSTLDPVSYQSYHGGSESIQVDMLSTWMCQGYTGGQETCASPYEALELSREPAAQNNL